MMRTEPVRWTVWQQPEIAAGFSVRRDALREHQTSAQKTANRLAPVWAQLEWLRQIGFVDVDCYFKYLELTFFAGFRP
jgi:tRNA (cmo5U34)-methyltransferase